MPDVTVVIPTCNRWHLLSAGALPSALAQEEVDLEVVVVDDGSTDETASGLASVADDRVRVVTHSSPQGLARARNSGIAAARGGWIAFLDDDDLWAPWKLRTQLELARSENAGIVYPPALYVTGDDVTLEPAVAPDGLRSRLMAGEAIPAGGSNVLAPADALRRVGGFDERIVHLGDFDCWIRLGAICRAARCEEPLLAYVQHAGAMHLGNAGRVAADVRHLHRKYRIQYEDLGTGFDGKTFVVWIADQHRAAGRLRQAGSVYLTAAWHFRDLRLAARGAPLIAAGRVRRLRRRARSRQAEPPALDASRRQAAPPWLARYRAEKA